MYTLIVKNINQYSELKQKINKLPTEISPVSLGPATQSSALFRCCLQVKVGAPTVDESQNLTER